MPPVRVDLGDKNSAEFLKNHRPEFRPTDSDKLYGAERKIAAAVNKIADAIPEDVLVDFIYDRVNISALTNRINDLLTEEPYLLERPLYEAFQSGAEDAAEQQRRDVNERLRRLGSPVVLRSSAELRKAKDQVLWEADPRSFNQSDPNAPGRIFARFAAQNILTDLVESQRKRVEFAISNAFLTSQSFDTGRTVQGLTPDQTAQTIYAILNDTSPTVPTGADLAAVYVGPTRGLTERYAAAVIKHGNAVAFERIQAGKSARSAGRTADEAMEAYGRKLRRARARAIARTEISVAQNAGLQHQHNTMIASGVASLDSEKEWVTGPFDVCDICVPLGGRRVPVGEDFFWRGGSGNPPAHPNCRCKTRLNPSIARAPRRIGEGTEEDPFRYEFPDGWIAPLTPTAPPRPRPAPTTTPLGRPIDPVQPAKPREPNKAKYRGQGRREELEYQLDSGILAEDMWSEFERLGVEAGRESPAGMWRYTPVNEDDPALGVLAREQGFTKKPQIVSPAEMQQLVDNNGYIRVWRGLAAQDEQVGQGYALQWKIGDEQFHGKGIFGNGTYSSTRRETAEGDYAGGDGAQLMEMALNPAANIIDLQDLRDIQEELNRALDITLPNEPDVNDPRYAFRLDPTPENAEAIEAGRVLYAGDMRTYEEEMAKVLFNHHFLSDEGRVGTFLGYDAIRVEEERLSGDENYYVILNRGIVAVVG